MWAPSIVMQALLLCELTVIAAGQAACSGSGGGIRNQQASR